MSDVQGILRFGAPPGAPGIVVTERTGSNALLNAQYGTTFFFGVLKRGPINVPTPIRSRKEYDELFGDPKNTKWHLFPKSEHLMPDALDGYFANSNGSGTVFVTRLDLDKKARKASVILKSRTGADTLKVSAASEGRWGGYKNSIALTPVVTATTKTFTLVAPGTKTNEFVDAEVEFSGIAKKYTIVSNTEANEISGETVFTVGAQYDLSSDGVVGPVALTGTASYTRTKEITGTVAFPLYQALTGTVNINNTVIVGSGTNFTSELMVQGNIYYLGEARVVTSITSNTTLTIDAPFSVTNASAVTVQTDNVVVTGTGTQFTTELVVGDILYATINNQLQARHVAVITSATSLKLASGYTDALVAGSKLSVNNYTVTGTGTAFTTEITPGKYIIDPNRRGTNLKVVAVTSATSLTVDGQFANDFTAASLTKQNQLATMTLAPKAGEGLSVEIGQGIRYPDTHFSMTVYFNGSQVMYIQDASLDPADALFVEDLVNQANLAFRQNGGQDVLKWISVENLWNSVYTTATTNDVRPCNGAGLVLAVTKEKIYTVGDFDYASTIGNVVYPNPYKLPRGYFRVKKASPYLDLQGTVSSSGVDVVGTNSYFLSEIKAGDYLYDPVTQTARKVRIVISDSSLTLETAFPSNMPALTKAKKAGYLEVDQSYDLTTISKIGDRFLVQYPIYLEKGYDGDTSHILPSYFTKYADIDYNYIENAVFGGNYGLFRIVVPGISDNTVQKAFGAYASQKAGEFRAEIPSWITTAAAAESFLNQELGRNDFVSIAFPSYAYIANPLGSGDRFVPITGDITGGESRFAVSNESYHVPFAGVKAILPRVLKLVASVTPTDESVLNMAGIQPIKMMYGNAVVFGGRGPALSPVYDFLHIRRTQSHYVRLFLEARALLELMFLPNQPNVGDQIIMILENFARSEYKKGVYSRFLTISEAVQVNSDTGLAGNSLSNEASGQDILVSIINGKLNIYYRYVPSGVVETLFINASPDILVAKYGETLAKSGSL